MVSKPFLARPHYHLALYFKRRSLCLRPPQFKSNSECRDRQDLNCWHSARDEYSQAWVTGRCPSYASISQSDASLLDYERSVWAGLGYNPIQVVEPEAQPTRCRSNIKGAAIPRSQDARFAQSQKEEITEQQIRTLTKTTLSLVFDAGFTGNCCNFVIIGDVNIEVYHSHAA